MCFVISFGRLVIPSVMVWLIGVFIIVFWRTNREMSCINGERHKNMKWKKKLSIDTHANTFVLSVTSTKQTSSSNVSILALIHLILSKRQNQENSPNELETKHLDTNLH